LDERALLLDLERGEPHVRDSDCTTKWNKIGKHNASDAKAVAAMRLESIERSKRPSPQKCPSLGSFSGFIRGIFPLILSVGPSVGCVLVLTTVQTTVVGLDFLVRLAAPTMASQIFPTLSRLKLAKCLPDLLLCVSYDGATRPEASPDLRVKRAAPNANSVR
jgi:hypothetical protein